MWKPPSPSEAPQSPPELVLSAGSTLPLTGPPTTRTKNPGRRFGQVIRLKRDHAEEYKACHERIWPEVAKQIKDCGMVDYSIFYDDALGLLFSTFKYIGYDYTGDMERMAENPKVREWWTMTDSFQESLVSGAVSSEAGVPSWWKPMEEVFYQA
ncbi:hypothetical protein QQS21_011417 [Conoideocrella luteorostrata]|uniref:DUF718 domain protein n=1 Tax=Conoideocrella luteorostrata TaxID=1105319 RepID=A0AAJ0FTR4_9HYPO|nr:hypothetical protein QQS21_011417 [Conoideocrella luteorostrata]